MVSRPLRRLVRRLLAIAAAAVALLTLAIAIYLAPLSGVMRLGARASADASADLHLITFNFDGSNREHQRVAAWLRERAPDVVLIQETYAIAGAQIPGTRQFLPYWVEQQTRAGYRGMSLLSRYPFSDLEGYDQDSPYSRAVVDLPTGTVAIYTVSLENPVNDRTGQYVTSPLDLLYGYNSGLRDRQIRLLIDRLETETLPTIVAGDFNLMEIEAPYHWLRARLTDVYAAVGRGTGATWRADLPLLRIDYVWADESWCPLTAQVGPELGSDHFPVEVTLAAEGCR